MKVPRPESGLGIFLSNELGGGESNVFGADLLALFVGG